MINFILTLPFKMLFYPIKYSLKFIKFLIDLCRELFPKNYYLEQIDNMSGLHFEQASKNILMNNGFYDVKVTQSSGDFGIDVLAKKNHKKYAIQCKKYSNSVGITAVQEVFAGCKHYSCDVPAILTNSYFTNQAIELAKSTGVELWDRDTLKRMCKKRKSKSSSYNFDETSVLNEDSVIKDANEIFDKIDYYNTLINNEKTLYKTVEYQMEIYELCKQLQQMDEENNGKIGLSTSPNQVLYIIKKFIKDYINEHETKILYMNNRYKEIEELEQLFYELISIKNTFPIFKEYVDVFIKRINMYIINLKND